MWMKAIWYNTYININLNIFEVHNVILTLKIDVYVKNLDFLGQKKYYYILQNTFECERKQFDVTLT